MTSLYSDKVWGGALIIGGTAIGAGMLALPAEVAACGFGPALLLFFVAWLFMLTCGFLLAEVYLWYGEDAHFLGVTEDLLGTTGRWIAGFNFLLLLYSANWAFISGGSHLLHQSFMPQLSHVHAITAFFAAIALLMSMQPHVIDYVNRILMLGLGAAYSVLLCFTLPHIQWSFLTHADWTQAPSIFPILVIAFCYQFVIPSLKRYLNHDRKALMASMLLGSILPLILYLLWILAIIGSVPSTGPGGLKTLAMASDPIAAIITTLEQSFPTHQFLVSGSALAFSMLAIFTSLIGVTLSLRDFLFETLQLEGYPAGLFISNMLALIPTTLLTVFFPESFSIALRYAGIFIAILIGIIPVLMVWRGRYRQGKQLPGTFSVPGGRLTLMAVMLLSLALMAVVGWKHFLF